MTTFTEKVVLVTGANSGIGESAADAFLGSGAHVYALVRRESAMAEARGRHVKTSRT